MKLKQTGFMKNVEILDDLSDECWCSYLQTTHSGSIFNHPSWAQVIGETYGYRPFVIVLRNTEGAICAGIPLMEINSPFTGKRWVSLPFSDYCQPIADTPEALNELTAYIVAYSGLNKINNLDLRWKYTDSSVLQHYCGYVIHEISLAENTSIMQSNIHDMHRRNIKLALNNGVQVFRGQSKEYLREFYKMHLQTRHRQGVPVQPWKFFATIYEKILKKDMGFILLAYKENVCIAGAVFLYWHETLTYKYGASTLEGLSYRPNNLLMWKAIEWGCDNGYKRMDLGRTSLNNIGLRTFKSRWGASETLLHYSTLNIDSVNSDHNMLSRWANVFVQHSPLWVCRLSGELLYKYFG